MSRNQNSPSQPPPLATVAALALLAMALLQVPGFRSEAYAQSPTKLVGTWAIQVTLTNCATGAPVAPAFPSLQTFISSGSMIEQGSRIGAPGTADRTIGQGIWEYEGRGSYGSFFRFFTFNADGSHLATLEATRTTVVGVRGRSLATLGIAKVFDPNGNLLSTLCSSESGERLSFPD